MRREIAERDHKSNRWVLGNVAAQLLGGVSRDHGKNIVIFIILGATPKSIYGDMNIRFANKMTMDEARRLARPKCPGLKCFDGMKPTARSPILGLSVL